LSDITVPSWRPQPERGRASLPWLAIAGGALALVALVGAVLWGFSRSGPRVVPVVQADPRPIKFRPADAGGMIVPNQDQKVLEPLKERKEAERNAGPNSRLAPGAERPQLDGLRQQIQPPEPPRDPQTLPKIAGPSAAPPAPLAPPAPPANGSALQAPSLPAPVPPQAAKPAQPPAVAPKPVAGGRGVVQLSAVDSEDAAKAEWARLARRVPELAAFKPAIVKVERDGQPTLWRVRAAGLADLAAARALCDIVKAKGAGCIAQGG